MKICTKGLRKITRNFSEMENEIKNNYFWTLNDTFHILIHRNGIFTLSSYREKI